MGTIENEKELLESGDPYRKMEDVELVLRFFAYRHLDKLSSFKSQEKFIDEFLNQANKFSDETIQDLKNIFEKTVNLLNLFFGEEAFYMPEGLRSKTTPTKTIYDPLMQAISKLLDKEVALLDKIELIKTKKYKDKENLTVNGRDEMVDLFDGKYNSKNNVEARIAYFDMFFNEILNS